MWEGVDLSASFQEQAPKMQTFRKALEAASEDRDMDAFIDALKDVLPGSLSAEAVRRFTEETERPTME